ncbi:type VII secretion-associated serine protease mycosin [Streptomyces sp. NPDC050095]|uniref:type VII secretion-associated serine protease mycosin n=1 Tax=unclassified Streptomyces TaxID=2593676 RepID=UPI00343545C4
MRTSSSRSSRRGAAASAALAALLLGGATTSAHAETVRSQQWFLDAMKAEQMWRTSTGKGITVAVIDSGVDAAQPDLKGRVLQGKDLSLGQPGDAHTDYDTGSHGTGMAGLIAGTGARAGGAGAHGLAPGAKILPIRLPKSGEVNQATGDKQFTTAIVQGIRYAADAGAQVINISQASAATSPQVTEAVKYAVNHGSLIFAGVGNDGATTNEVRYPAATPGVVGVGAIGKDLKRTSESTFGTQVDVSAPGADMVHACAGTTGLCNTHGTSEATAVASASAALIWSAHPKWTNNQVLRVMLNTIGAPTDGSKRTDAIGYGIVRPRIALTNPGDPGPADEYPLPDLAAADASAAPKPSTSKEPGTTASDEPAAAATTKDDGTSPLLWGGIGGGVLLVGAAAAWVLTRNRRRTPPVSYTP